MKKKYAIFYTSQMFNTTQGADGLFLMCRYDKVFDTENEAIEHLENIDEGDHYVILPIYYN